MNAKKKKFFDIDVGETSVLNRHGNIRPILFITLCFVLVMIVANSYNEIQKLFPSIIIAVLIIVNNAIKLWAIEKFKHKIICYAVDSLLFLFLTMFSTGSTATDNVTLVTLYLLFLTEFYLSSEKFLYCLIMGFASIAAFLVTYYMTMFYILRVPPKVVDIIVQSLTNILIIAIHFVMVNVALVLYRNKLKTDAALKELAESNEKLQRANAELKEMTSIQERQRIAKEIHDTAGHSITTFIMQTEAARLIVDSNPEEAKIKLAAASLQARHALEELRSGVHLLSGRTEQTSLKQDIQKIITDTSTGTDINIRSDVEDLTLPPQERVFITNSLKEGLSNGMRHGGATAFYVELSKQDDSVTFILSDNGCGVTGTVKEGFGLSGMRRRTEELNGNIAFSSEDGEGFEIKIVLPYKGEDEQTNAQIKGEEKNVDKSIGG